MNEKLQKNKARIDELKQAKQNQDRIDKLNLLIRLTAHADELHHKCEQEKTQSPDQEAATKAGGKTAETRGNSQKKGLTKQEKKAKAKAEKGAKRAEDKNKRANAKPKRARDPVKESKPRKVGL